MSLLVEQEDSYHVECSSQNLIHAINVTEPGLANCLPACVRLPGTKQDDMRSETTRDRSGKKVRR